MFSNLIDILIFIVLFTISYLLETKLFSKSKRMETRNAMVIISAFMIISLIYIYFGCNPKTETINKDEISTGFALYCVKYVIPVVLGTFVGFLKRFK